MDEREGSRGRARKPISGGSEGEGEGGEGAWRRQGGSEGEEARARKRGRASLYPRRCPAYIRGAVSAALRRRLCKAADAAGAAGAAWGRSPTVFNNKLLRALRGALRGALWGDVVTGARAARATGKCLRGARGRGKIGRAHV